MKLGDVVQLKSGGPLMTIERAQAAHHFSIFGYHIERKAYVICQWFEEDTRWYTRKRFLPEQVQVCPSLSEMSFRELKNFEIEATARRINK